MHWAGSSGNSTIVKVTEQSVDRYEFVGTYYTHVNNGIRADRRKTNSE